MVNHLKQQLAHLQSIGGLRRSRPLHVQAWQATDSQSDAQTMVNFSSNDYLGLAGDTHLIDDFFAAIDLSQRQNWMSSSSARPLTGTSLTHAELELTIARDYHKDKALLFNSGYHANSGILPALAGPQDLILADKLVHASIIDGLRLGGAKFKRFAHNDMVHLEQLLTRYADGHAHVWIVTESVFSMDGDLAPLASLVDLKQRFSASLYVDEAHALGCYGPSGLGLAEQLGLLDQVDILVGVFGKALAGVGAFVVANATIIDSLINFSRSWLFSTALPPINIDWNLFVWQQLSSMQTRQQRLHDLTQSFRQQLLDVNLSSLGESHIVPLLRVGNEAAINTSEYLEKQGFLAMPIRSPTVKKGSERVRFSLTANLPEECLSAVVQALATYDEC